MTRVNFDDVQYTCKKFVFYPTWMFATGDDRWDRLLSASRAEESPTNVFVIADYLRDTATTAEINIVVVKKIHL